MNLQQFQLAYNGLEADNKLFSLNSWDFALQLNKQLGFDAIIMREGYQNYPNKTQLQKNKTVSIYKQFFNYLTQNLATIESNYLKTSENIKAIEQAGKEDKALQNYLCSKDSISKFIRDEPTHYQAVLNKYLQNVNQTQQERGVPTTQFHNLFVELFTNKYVRIILNSNSYLGQPMTEIQTDIANQLSLYCKQTKNTPDHKSKKEQMILEEQILDFLTFWLKKKSKDNINVIYARTKQRLDHQQHKLLAGLPKIQENLVQINKKYLIQQKLQYNFPLQPDPSKQQFLLSQKAIKDTIQEFKAMTQPNQLALRHQIGINHKSSQKQQFQTIKMLGNSQIKSKKTKNQLLNAQMKNLFKFGCQRTYKFNKNSTFGQIEQATNTMTLQQFLYFCNFFELIPLINRQKAIQNFKAQSINRLIDFNKFQLIIKNMIENNSKIIHNLLSKKTFQVKKNKNAIIKDQKIQRLSQYKFVLRPVNGMDVSTIQKQLGQRKLLKIVVRQEKQKMAYDRRDGQKQVRQIKKSRSQFQSKFSALDLEPIRDISFNPESLLRPEQDHDRVWQDYQAKIWKKQPSSNNKLEQILSKRIARGNRIINKMNSQISFGLQ